MDLSKFWDSLDKDGDGGCWNWTLGKDRNGYGQVYFLKKNHRSNRVAWELSSGEIPDDSFVCHKCNNPSCCNPDHLYLGDASSNMTDRANSGSYDQGGENNNAAKLTWEDVNLIRYWLKVGYSESSVAKAFGSSKSNVYNIKSRRTWNKESG